MSYLGAGGQPLGSEFAPVVAMAQLFSAFLEEQLRELHARILERYEARWSHQNH